MRLTNRYGLPDPIIRALENDDYDKGDAHISVTGLIAPARMKALETIHGDAIEEDAADMLFLLFGKLMHDLLERTTDQTEALTEKRLFIQRYGWTISGKFDRLSYIDGVLADWKFTSVHAVSKGLKDEWAAQLNIYNLMLREHGRAPKRLEIYAPLRDWQKAKARHSPDYPQYGFKRLEVPVWPAEQTEAFIRQRLTAHGHAQHGTLPDCTAEERWRKADVYAVMGEGNSRATATYDDHAEAMARADEETAKGRKAYHVEERTGENTRCMFYCPVSQFCDQWKRINPDRLGLMGGNRAA